MHNLQHSLMKQTTFKHLYSFKTYDKKNQVEAKQCYITMPTTQVFTPSTKWEVVHHGGDMLASDTR